MIKKHSDHSSPCCPVCGYTFAGIEIKYGSLSIVTTDLATFVSCTDNPNVHFTQSESVLLAALAMARGRVVPKTMLYDQLYRSDNIDVDPKILDVHLCKIRKKIMQWGLPISIKSVWGRGWILDPPGELTENHGTDVVTGHLGHGT